MSLPNWAREYLRHLGAQPEAPGLAALTRLIHRHLSTCPFENLTKLVYFERFAQTGWYIPPITEFVANLTRLDAGGTCFTQNSSFVQLLQALGYDAYLIRFNMGHMGIGVRLNGNLYYVDVGVGGPTFTPVNLSAGEARLERCGSGLHLYPHAEIPDMFHFDHYLHGERRLQWEFFPFEPAPFSRFTEFITKQNTPGTLFMTILRCQLWQPDRGRNLSLANNTLVIRYDDGTERKQVLPDADAVDQVLADEFGKPRLPLREALRVLNGLGVDPFQPEPQAG